jgi:hypothetical protein
LRKKCCFLWLHTAHKSDDLEYLKKKSTSLKINAERKTYMLFVLYIQIGSLTQQTYASLVRAIEESLFYSFIREKFIFCPQIEGVSVSKVDAWQREVSAKCGIQMAVDAC